MITIPIYRYRFIDFVKTLRRCEDTVCVKAIDQVNAAQKKPLISGRDVSSQCANIKQSVISNDTTHDKQILNEIADTVTHNQEKPHYFDELQSWMKILSKDISYADLENTILYDGNPLSKIMLIGEAPGAEEVIQHKPFVGRSGQLLQSMLDAAGLQRNKIYITNVMPWRPPLNRPPLPYEIDIMRPALMEHIRYIQPDILILVGSIAYKAFTGSTIAISKVRGQWFGSDLCENVIPIFHPSFLLRSPTQKKHAWRDITSIALLAHKMSINIVNTCLKIS
jgi:uracil-DNA glycosylase family 4